MNPEVFAEWLRRQGHHVIQTQSSYWYDQGPRVYQAFPYHWEICPGEDELQGLLRGEKAIALRYSTPVSADYGAISYHAIYDDETHNLENLGKWARKNIRRGLTNCEVTSIPFERLAVDGWLLQLDTLDRQGRKVKLGQDQWAHRCMAAKDLPGFEAWGALSENVLVASVITFQMGEWVYMLYQRCRREFLPAHVNNALGFVVTREMRNREGVRSILYGLHSLDAPASVDEFKFRMGYRAKPVRQRVVFHPVLKPLLDPVTFALVGGLHKLAPGNPLLSKAEGMLRFYRQGLRSLAEQEWPPPLNEQKAGNTQNAPPLAI